MFDYIKGELTERTENNKGLFFTVDVNGIGYLVEVTKKEFYKKEDGEIKLFTVLNHKEDAMTLCGFLTRQMRDIFKILTSVSGVGLKMGLTLLNEFDTQELITFVINEDFKSLTLAKGVGVKLAQKIILELKDKLINLQPNVVENFIDSGMKNFDDVQKVLLSLGYDNDEIKSAIKRVSAKLTQNSKMEEVLKLLLTELSK